MDDDAKKIILARRARFVAATIAGIAGVQACSDAAPRGAEACLSMVAAGTGGAGGKGGAGAGGQAATGIDAGLPGDAGTLGEGGAGGEGGAPRVCLSLD